MPAPWRNRDFALLAPFGLFGLLAGVAADRWSRWGLMIACDVVRALAVATLAVALAGEPGLWLIVAVAFVEGSGAAVFSAAAAGALRGVVPSHGRASTS